MTLIATFFGTLSIVSGLILAGWLAHQRFTRDDSLQAERDAAARWHDLYDAEHHRRVRAEHERDQAVHDKHKAEQQRDALKLSLDRLKRKERRAQKEAWG